MNGYHLFKWAMVAKSVLVVSVGIALAFIHAHSGHPGWSVGSLAIAAVHPFLTANAIRVFGPTPEVNALAPPCTHTRVECNITGQVECLDCPATWDAEQEE